MSSEEESIALSTPGDAPTHEWFRTFADLETFFKPSLLDHPGRTAEEDPLILHLGSVDSTIPAELAIRGYKRQMCVDFSPVVVEMMSERHWKIAGIQWKSIDVAFDKGTLDAMIHGSPWNPPDDVKENTSKYLQEIHRVLKDDGVFLYITFRQLHFMRPLLNAPGGGMLEYFCFQLKKKKPSS
ncbi:hypothetical protein B0H63DRAFT_498363 [Podospora didyma]|uniref:Methyltransferase type 11 domain-containing protein n=1 Tax=Podospora didyma TaxID=330526 RepID=A0AAE0P3X9_9PEZI|nr:hypothetical protein B0H63DRAFT_498363 [Podospora didyma]